MHRLIGTIVVLLPVAAGGSVSTAVGVVKAPFQVAGKAIDWTTTSQDEADRNYGRTMRKAEAREGKERRAYADKCRRDPRSDACLAGYRGYTVAGDPDLRG